MGGKPVCILKKSIVKVRYNEKWIKEGKLYGTVLKTFQVANPN